MSHIVSGPTKGGQENLPITTGPPGGGDHIGRISTGVETVPVNAAWTRARRGG
ncbi:hypothetical protein FF36_04298 [Frankia torreyi]|uniref:Uncharacterized protein n=1 Tax=Frankia torreyi TaxID=1856 RepID=A0A0D8BDA5_9ACTN|nr:hypothetical protein FF36_04298 [Frankia torreyi]KQM03458.1 hypothetical protein FF86_104041 [Frankia sp. CpI1-P]